MHTLVWVSEKVEGKELSVEERLRLVEDELAKIKQIFSGDELAKIRQLFNGDELTKIRQLLTKLVEKGTEGSSGDPLTKGDR